MKKREKFGERRDFIGTCDCDAKMNLRMSGF
jgi:hypothetical protein